MKLTRRALALLPLTSAPLLLTPLAHADTVTGLPQGDPVTERLWLLAGLALSLTAAAVVAVAALRSRRP
ncbi:hypothetical protein ACFVIM_05695 [Streptomyces sp. NPDC057638]|uniref:hypothetical protein n=1 Tax=Streptomyces sp. NPDC057638 TaxID=3346190 RepID=UPI003674CC88